MKVLVLEDNSKVSEIYQKIFIEKRLEADFVKNEAEFLKKANDYDYLISEKPLSTKNPFLEQSEKDCKQDRNFLFLSSIIPKNNLQPSTLSKETRDLLEKPFAMITLLAKLELGLKKEALMA